MTSARREHVEVPPETIAAIEASLRPCPFCGPLPAMPELVRGDGSRMWQVFCGPCGSSSGTSRDPAAAAASWNSRSIGGPELPTSSAAITSLAIMLSNSLKDMTPTDMPPMYGFRSPERQQMAYALAHQAVATMNETIPREDPANGTRASEA